MGVKIILNRWGFYRAAGLKVWTFLVGCFAGFVACKPRILTTYRIEFADIEGRYAGLFVSQFLLCNLFALV